MSSTIRAAGIQDIASIQRIARAVWPDAYREILSAAQLAYMLELFYSDDALGEQMQGRGHRFFLASDGAGQSVGFASFSVKDGVAHLHKLYVLPETQGTGTGRDLLQVCEDGAQALGAAAMQLNVNRHNRARTFYERRGYCIIREEDITIGAGYFMNDYRMEKILHPQPMTV